MATNRDRLDSFFHRARDTLGTARSKLAPPLRRVARFLGWILKLAIAQLVGLGATQLFKWLQVVIKR